MPQPAPAISHRPSANTRLDPRLSSPTATPARLGESFPLSPFGAIFDALSELDVCETATNDCPLGTGWKNRPMMTALLLEPAVLVRRIVTWPLMSQTSQMPLLMLPVLRLSSTAPVLAS